MTEGILGGFIGSLLTVLIARICDLIQKKNEHQYSLKKSYFERKLSVAEATTSQRLVILSALANYVAVLKVMEDNLPLILTSPPDFMKTMVETANQQMKKLSEPAFTAANAASLFFEAPDKLDVSTMKELMDLFVSIDAGGKQLQFLSLLFGQITDMKRKEAIVTEATRLVTKMQSDITKLSDKFERGYNEIIGNIASMRNQMKKYES